MFGLSIDYIGGYKPDGSVAQLVEQRPFKPKHSQTACPYHSKVYLNRGLRLKTESVSKGTVEPTSKSQK